MKKFFNILIILCASLVLTNCTEPTNAPATQNGHQEMDELIAKTQADLRSQGQIEKKRESRNTIMANIPVTFVVDGSAGTITRPGTSYTDGNGVKHLHFQGIVNAPITGDFVGTGTIGVTLYDYNLSSGNGTYQINFGMPVSWPSQSLSGVFNVTTAGSIVGFNLSGTSGFAFGTGGFSGKILVLSSIVENPFGSRRFEMSGIVRPLF